MYTLRVVSHDGSQDELYQFESPSIEFGGDFVQVFDKDRLVSVFYRPLEVNILEDDE